MEEQTSAGLLGVHLLPLVTIMMLQSMNTVSFQDYSCKVSAFGWGFLQNYSIFHVDHDLWFTGLPREPKYTHLKDLHNAIKQSEEALVSTNPIIASLGQKQEVFFYSDW